MKHRVRGLLAALLAASALALCVDAASATSIALSNSGIRMTFPEFTIQGVGFTIRCPVTLEGSFHSRTMSKTANGLIGHITRVSIRSEACTGGRMTPLLAGLPWHMQYRSFTGTLPAIRSIEMQIVGGGWLVEISALSCLYRTTQSTPAEVIAEILEGKIRTARWSAANIPLTVGSGLCPGEIRYGGGGAVTVLGGREEIEVTLAF